MNWKTLGDLAQNCVIGELSKYGLGIAFPLSDNYPFDLIVIANSRLFKVQVRGSSTRQNNSAVFQVTKSNFYTGEKIIVAKEDIDVFAMWDFNAKALYLLERDKIIGKTAIAIRDCATKNKQTKRINLAQDCIASEKRIKEVFDFDTPDYTDYFSKNKNVVKQYEHVCEICYKKFTNGHKRSKYCTAACKGAANRKVIRPTYDQLKQDMSELPMIHIGAKYGVSDNAIRKWLKGYKKEENLKTSLDPKRQV